VDEEEDVQNATGATIAVGERVDGFDHPQSSIPNRGFIRDFPGR
jgi:hypothetical protein